MGTPVEPEAVDGLIDGKGLAAMLGVSPATVRSWRNRGVDWLPDPIGRLDGLVWREQDIADIKELVLTTADRQTAAKIGARTDRLIQRPERRARGAYYTPGDAAHFMAKWLVRQGGETYLEPSLGDGAFIEAVADVTMAAGLDRPQWVAGELDAATAQEAVERGLVTTEEIQVGDYLTQPVRLVEAAIGNPPYVRLRHLDDGARTAALTASREYLGIQMAPSGSVWMPFVLKMVASIKLGGRMAVVLPLDFTYVTYALPLWEHLGQSFSTLRVLRSRERIFAEINQDVLILLADGRGGTTEHVEYAAFETVADMVAEADRAGGQVAISSITAGERAFQRALLPDGLEDMLANAAKAGWIVPASNLATFRIGYVAGHKKYFHPDPTTIKKFRLPASSLRRALVNARKLRGQGLRTSGVDESLADHLWLPQGPLTAGEKRYVAQGEHLEVDQGYKASLRKPWYSVPGVKDPDAIISVFSERPMVLVNDAEWVATNSFLCAYTRGVSAEELAAAWYNPLTLLSIGLEVHSLGGGVMVMVPNEASRVAVLNPDKLTGDLEQIDQALHRGDIAAAYNSGTVSLTQAFGEDGAALIQQGIDTLSRWRTR